MPIVLSSNNYNKNSVEIINNELPAGFKLITLDKLSKIELVKKIVKADYLLASGRLPIDKEVINAAVKLKMIQRTGVGLDCFDLSVLKSRNIPVYVNRGVNSRSVAEHALMLILAVLRRLPYVDSSVKNGEWRKHELGLGTYELHKKTIGLVGVGYIGTELIKMLKGFNVRIVYFDLIRISSAEENKLSISYLPFEELLKEVDILSLHCPLTQESEGMIGKEELTLMKPGSILINTSRGRLVDEKALVENIESGHLKGAGLDVFYEEPLKKNSPLLKLNNVVLTPHLGGVTIDAFRRMMSEAFRNIQLFENGMTAELEEKRVKL